MKSLPRLSSQLAVVLLGLGTGVAQISVGRFPPVDETKAPTALIRSVRVIPTADGPAVEIITTRPANPKILRLQGPERLVIDLPKTLVSKSRIDFRSEDVSGIRVNQFQQDPPMARIVVDLNRPVSYSWDAAGNRLMVRLRPDQSQMAQSASGFTQGIAPNLVPIGPGASTALVMAGKSVMGGSSVSAGADTAIMHLARGGEVRVCPGTTVSVTYSQNGRDMMLAMNQGTLETHYTLQSSADSVMTPDFRILFAGPGEFNYAISADSRGNTCVRSLPGNTASAIVSELIGDSTYQVRSFDQVMFQGGRVSSASKNIPPDCGCPAQSVPVLQTSAPAPLPQKPVAESVASNTGIQVAATGPVTAPLPPAEKNQIQVQIDAPFVFRATDPQAVPEAPTREVAQLREIYWRRIEPLEVMVLPPPQAVATKPKPRGLFGVIKGVFAAIFR